MSFLKTSQLVFVGMSIVAAPMVFASGTSTGSDGQTVRLVCPAGTVQKGSKVTNEAVYCMKTKPQSGEPVPHGPYVDFYKNGQKQSEGQYKDGFRSGHWTFWDANGMKAGETDFEAGDYHGARVEYYPNGNKKLEQQWVHGKRDGVVAAYSANGQKVSETSFRGDRVVKEQRFENGKPVAAK